MCRERHGRGVEDSAGGADGGDDKDKLERVDDVVTELRCGYVEAKEERRGEAEDGGNAEDRADADEEAGGDAPGQLLRSGSHAEESEDGKDDATVGPVVMDGGWACDEADKSWFAGLHLLQDRLPSNG